MLRPNCIKANKFKTLSNDPHSLVDQNKSVGNLRAPLPLVVPSKQSQQTKFATYKNLNKDQTLIKQHTVKVDKVFQLFSKAQIMYKLRFETIFLAYSIVEQTVHIAQKMESNQYFIVCCLYIAMKYEEIYPPRLKQLAILVKCNLRKEIYQKNQKIILKELDYNLRFQGINQSLSQYLQSLSSSQMYCVFYLLEITLTNRLKFNKFTLKEIVLSVIYILCSHSIYLSSKDQIDGVPFQKIQTCSKMIVLCQIQSENQFPAIHKKFRSDFMKFTSIRSLPICESLTNLFIKKASQQVSFRKTVMKLQNLHMQEQTQGQSDEMKIDKDQTKRDNTKRRLIEL